MNQQYFRDERSLTVGRLGSQHSVIGDPVNFYVFISGDPAKSSASWSSWIKGKPRLHQELVGLFENKKRRKFADKVGQLLEEHP